MLPAKCQRRAAPDPPRTLPALRRLGPLLHVDLDAADEAGREVVEPGGDDGHDKAEHVVEDRQQDDGAGI